MQNEDGNDNESFSMQNTDVPVDESQDTFSPALNNAQGSQAPPKAAQAADAELVETVSTYHDIRLMKEFYRIAPVFQSRFLPAFAFQYRQ
eukprot:g68257.t1